MIFFRMIESFRSRSRSTKMIASFGKADSVAIRFGNGINQSGVERSSTKSRCISSAGVTFFIAFVILVSTGSAVFHLVDKRADSAGVDSKAPSSTDAVDFIAVGKSPRDRSPKVPCRHQTVPSPVLKAGIVRYLFRLIFLRRLLKSPILSVRSFVRIIGHECPAIFFLRFSANYYSKLRQNHVAFGNASGFCTSCQND